MARQPLFERPIQTIIAVSEKTEISRITLAQAAQRGAFGEDAYQSGATWLIDTNGEHFHQWLTAHWQQARVKRQQEKESKGEEN